MTFVRAGVGVAALCCATAALAAPPPPRGPHPRIALTAPVLSTLKRQLASPGSAVAAAVRACRASDPATGAPSGYQGDQWAFPASACGLAYQLTGDRAYAAKGTRLLRALLEDVERVGDGKGCVAGASPEQTIAAVRRDTGYAIRFIATHAALAYDWLHDAPGVEEPFRAHARRCLGAWVDWYSKDGYLHEQPGANYHAGFVIAKTLIAVATAGEGEAGDRQFREVVDDVFARQIVGNGLAADAGGRVSTRRRGVLIGGDWAEGWQYGQLSVVEYAFAARVLGEHGAAFSPLAAWSDDITLRFVHGLLPGRDRMYVGGDFGDDKVFADVSGAVPLATLLGPSSARAAGWAASLRDSLDVREWGPPVFDAIASARAVAPIDPFAARPATWYLAAGTRNLYARSGWDRKAFWAVFTSSPRQVDDHQHVDASNFVFARGADALVVDPSPYGTRSSLTGNALTIDSDVVLKHYKPSQTPWSQAELVWARGAASGAVAARADLARAFDFQERPSDIPLARRDWVFLPEGEIVIIDRAITGGSGRSAYLRFRTPATLSLAGGVARGVTGGSALAIHAVTREPPAEPVVRAVPASSGCGNEGWGACTDARFPVGEYALRLTGPEIFAVHVLDGLGQKEAPAEVAALTSASVAGATVLRAGKRSFVVATRSPSPAPPPEIAYDVPGAQAARHVVFDAPEDGAARTGVTTRAQGASCHVALTVDGATRVANRPAMFFVGRAADGCPVTEDAPAPMDGVDPAAPRPALLAAPRPAARARRAGGCAVASAPATSPWILLALIALAVSAARATARRSCRPRPRSGSRWSGSPRARRDSR